MSSEEQPRLASPKRGWWWIAALLCLVVFVKLLLDHSTGGEAAGEPRGGMSDKQTGRKPFPRQGEFESIPRPGRVEPKAPSADPWQDGRKRE